MQENSKSEQHDGRKTQAKKGCQLASIDFGNPSFRQNMAEGVANAYSPSERGLLNMEKRVSRIVFTAEHYWPHEGGVERVTANLAEGLAKRGYDVVVITGRGMASATTERHNGVRIVRFPLRTEATLYFGPVAAYVQYVRNQLDESSVLINVCAQNPFTDALRKELPTLPGKKILHLHGIWEPTWDLWNQRSVTDAAALALNNLRWATYHRSKERFRGYDTILQLHEQDRAYRLLANYGYRGQDVIENSVDEDFFAANEPKKPGFNIIHIGNFFPVKNQLAILRSYYDFCRDKTDTSLTFIGSTQTDYYHQLNHLNSELEQSHGHKSVKILVGVSRQRLVSELFSSTILVLASHHEKMPMVILEALAAGVPYLSTDVGVVRHLGGGIVVPDETGLRKALETCYADQDMVVTLARDGRKWAESRYRHEHTLDRLESVIERVMSV